MRQQEIVATYDTRTGMNATDRIAIAEFKHEYMHGERWAKKARLDHLRQIWKYLKINDLMFDIQAEAWQNMPVHPTHHRMLARRHIRTLDKMIAVLREVGHIKRPKEKSRDSDVTPTMIARAREYPVKDILERNGYKVRGNRCQCPFHDGEDLNASIWRNYVHCHSQCQQRGDAITVSMAAEGGSFPAAVRRLAT